MDWLILLASVAWAILLLLPWRPWSTRERLEPEHSTARDDLSDVTVLIPARNEAGVIPRTLQALASQSTSLSVIVIDDGSSDGTADSARTAFGGTLRVVEGKRTEPGWTGKLWALEQGRRHVDTDLVLLLDADIELAPGMVAALKRKLIGERLGLVSIMAQLQMQTFWERLLLPAFIYFFKLLYPFALGNSPRSRLGVAAGGCILVRRETLNRIDAFGSLRGALIDDCALARKVKEAGGRTWIGLSHSVRSHRAYSGLDGIWNMVARSAYTQLRHSPWLLLATTAIMVLVYWFPFVGVFSESVGTKLVSAVSLTAMGLSYLPTLIYYRRSSLWVLALPVIGTLYLLMTWSSAIRHWRGRGAEWKGRVYGRS